MNIDEHFLFYRLEFTLYRISSLKMQGLFKSTNESFTVKKQRFKILIDQKYVIRGLLLKRPMYNLYEGVDIANPRYLSIYIKPNTAEFVFSKRIKEDLRAKICPPVIWTGQHKIEKVTYNVEVHQRLGPSLRSMFAHLRTEPSERDFLHLLYQMIRLVEKYSAAGYVYRQLDLDCIVFDPKPEKNELFLLNVFSMRKRNQECPALNTRFCSKGAHLGLVANIKDDLESICYILLSLFTKGQFLRNVQDQNYQQVKINLNFNNLKKSMPSVFVDFYNYISSLNYHDEINYFQWKNAIAKAIGKQTLSKPYQWMLSKIEKSQTIQTKSEDSGESQNTINGQKQKFMDQDIIFENSAKQISDEGVEKEIQQFNHSNQVNLTQKIKKCSFDWKKLPSKCEN